MSLPAAGLNSRGIPFQWFDGPWSVHSTGSGFFRAFGGDGGECTVTGDPRERAVDGYELIVLWGLFDGLGTDVTRRRY
jgi:hypothetical protein